MNVKLLRKVRDKILAEPDQFVMKGWFAQQNDIAANVIGTDIGAYGDLARVVPKCGAACIGGWTVALNQNQTPTEVMANLQQRCGHLPPIVELAAKMLDLPLDPEPYGLFPRLFTVDTWPEKFRQAWSRAKTTKQRAKVAASAINNYISTDGWNR